MPNRNRSATANQTGDAPLLADAEAAAPAGQKITAAQKPRDTEQPSRANGETVDKLARKRLGDFAALFAQAMIEDDAKTVHDLRVASRRLQQLLRGLPRAKGKKSAKKASSFLRDVRQALGPLRNLDVMAEMTEARAAASGNHATRAVWLEIKEAIEKQRAEESERAQEAIKEHDLTGFLDRMSRSLRQRTVDDTIDDDLQETIQRRFQSWSEALSEVAEEPTAKRLHALRIAGKRLRYSVELSAALIDPKLKSLAHSLAQLQDNLGAWHDVHTLMQYVDAYLKQREFSSEELKANRVLLAVMKRERERGDSQASEAVAAAQTLRKTWPVKLGEPHD